MHSITVNSNLIPANGTESYLQEFDSLDELTELSLGPYKSAAAMAAAVASMSGGYSMRIPDSPVSVASTSSLDHYDDNNMVGGWPTVSPQMLSENPSYTSLPFSISRIPSPVLSDFHGNGSGNNNNGSEGFQLVRRNSSSGHSSKIHRAGSHRHHGSHSGEAIENLSSSSPYFIKDIKLRRMNSSDSNIARGSQFKGIKQEAMDDSVINNSSVPIQPFEQNYMFPIQKREEVNSLVAKFNQEIGNYSEGWRSEQSNMNSNTNGNSTYHDFEGYTNLGTN